MHRKTILLFGMPRSGTTWIGKIFDSHPKTLYRHEPDSTNPIMNLPLFTHTKDISDKNIKLASDFILSIISTRQLKVCTKLPYFNKDYLNFVQNRLLKHSVYLTKLSVLSSIIKELPYSPDYKKKHNNFNLVWKSIESLGRLNIFLTNSNSTKGIHIVRHPCGYINSVLKGERSNKFSSQVTSSDDYGIFELLVRSEVAKNFNLSIKQLKKLSPIERLAWKWVLYNEITFNNCSNLPNYTITFYDELCSSPLSEIKRLFEFSELNWNKQTEKFIKSSTQNNNDSYYSIYKTPEKVANKWKSELTRDEINLIKPIIEYSSLKNSISF